jgi:hypothetical protein
LEIGHTHWVRFGVDKLVEELRGGNCGELEPVFGTSSAVGSAVVRVDIPEPGNYRFAALQTMPPGDVQISLQLRSECTDDDNPLACEHGVPEWIVPGSGFTGGGGPLGYLPQIDRYIEEPRTYYIVTGAALGVAPAEVQLAVARVDDWDNVPVPTRDVPWGWTALAPEPPPERLELDGSPTPSEEPLPDVTIDRLVRIRLHPGQVGAARVVLHGACFGTMAKLRHDPTKQAPLFDEAETCIDTENVRVPPAVEELDTDLTVPSQTLAGTFPEPEPCQDGLSTDLAVCAPGGLFMLGAREGAPGGDFYFPQPERIAIMSPLWIDRREVTVGRWHEAILRGFAPSPADVPFENDARLGTVDNPVTAKVMARLCTYSAEPRLLALRHDYPLNCVSWHAARAFCQFEGGDLPTSAQWEYVATKAGRKYETILPWGHSTPLCSADECEGDESCHYAVIHRSRRPEVDECVAEGFGPAPVTDYEHPVHGDMTVLINTDPGSRVFGLAGGMREFMRDSYHAYAAPCWRSNPLRDPLCWEQDAPVRESRGSNWSRGGWVSYGAARGAIRSSNAPRGTYDLYPHPLQQLGFRCAYTERPDR